MARRSVAEFLDSFVRPMIAGGDIRIGRPVTMEDVHHFDADLPHASPELVAVDDARTEVLAELVVRPPALVLGADELHLAAALHNALFLAHPDSEGWVLTKRARARIVDAASRLAAQPLSQDRRRVLARHALLHNVFDIMRVDTKVSWWTGSARFFGQKPPTRLLLWRSVRRVREETSTVRYDELLSSDEVAPIMATLLRRSPLTQLLSPHPRTPALHWEDAVFVLRDHELARAVAYEALAPVDPVAQVAGPARYAAAFEQMLERTPDAGDVRAVAAFLVHLNALLAVAELKLRDHASPSPLITTVLAPERAGQRPRGLTTFFALPNALAEIDPRVAEPPGVADEPRLEERWDIHRAQVLAGVGEAVIATLVARLSRHLWPGGHAQPALSAPAREPASEPGQEPR
jgi:hypothetical protein